MRIARYTVDEQPRFGIVELTFDGGDHPETIAEITGDPLAGRVQYTGARHNLDEVKLLSPVIPRSKVIGIGRNYVEHAKELGNTIPEEPLVFLKPNTSVIGPNDAIIYPSVTQDLHYEGELAIVIGRVCRDVPAERVQEVIFGYTCANDVSARDLQQSDGQWTRAKGFDTFCPLGPWLVTHLSVEEAGKLQLTTELNGKVVQNANAELMVRSISDLVCYVSSFMTLLPGDVILTGTPAGVGPMSDGDEVQVTISEIGTLSNTVVKPTA